ncbi:MAG: SGNH/GDSL hydrolase family protein [Planctomycetaceae bacterium]
MFLSHHRRFIIVALFALALGHLVFNTGRDSSLAYGQDTRLKIVTLGDSITRGYREGIKKDETFSAYLERNLKNLKYDVEVVNKGIGGERTDQGLKRLHKDVLDLKPHVVTIMYGANDSYVDEGKTASRISRKEFGDNLRELVEEIRAIDAIPILMTSTPAGKDHGPTGAGEHPNVRLSAYVQECRDMAKEMNVPLIDHYAEWMRMEKEGIDFGKTLMTDQVHPNPKGHELMAKSMLKTIEEALK